MLVTDEVQCLASALHHAAAAAGLLDLLPGITLVNGCVFYATEVNGQSLAFSTESTAASVQSIIRLLNAQLLASYEEND